MEQNTTTYNFGFWNRLNCTGEMPTPRQAVGGAMLNPTTLVIFGGGNMEGPYDNRTFTLDLKTNIWTEIKYTNKSHAPSQRGVMGVATLNNQMYIFGGYTGNSHLNDFHRLDFAKKKWKTLKPNTTTSVWPSERRGANFVTYNNKLYLYGGTNKRGESASPDVMQYDPETNEWKILLSTGIKAFRNACAIYQDKMLIFGGDIADLEAAFSTISASTFEYNFTTNTWRKLQTTGHVLALEAPSGVILKDKYFVVYGGFSQLGQCNRTFALNLETNVWKEIPLLMGNDSIRDNLIQQTEGGRLIHNCPEPRSFFVFGKVNYDSINKTSKCPLTGKDINDAMIIFGGRQDHPQQQYQYFNDTWAFELCNC